MRQTGARRETDSCYLALYHAQTPDELYQWMYREAGAVPGAADLLKQAFPAWIKASEPHWRRYQRFVERWVRDELSTEDWAQWGQWLGTDLQTIVNNIAPPPGAPRWSLAGWLLTAIRTHPHEPLAEAYRQIAERMIRERCGTDTRPQFCTACGRLFEPGRVTQRWCSTTCRYRINQRDARRRKSGVELGDASELPRIEPAAVEHRQS
ncbi:hypothetical protein [Nitrospira calida]|jgi:hypothetical protein